MNRIELAHQVSITLGDHADDYDIDAIVTDLIAAHDGDLNSIDDFDSQSYWAIVETHDTTAPASETGELRAWLNLEPEYLEGDNYEVEVRDADTTVIQAPIALPAPIGSEHEDAQAAAYRALVAAGWEADADEDWEQHDLGYTLRVRRAATDV